MKRYKYSLSGLDCANCARKIEEKLASNKKYQNVSVNFSTLRLSFETDIENPYNEVCKIIKSVEPEVFVMNNDLKYTNNKVMINIARLLIGIGFALIGFSNVFPTIVSEMLIIVSYAILLFRTIENAYKLLVKNKTINENLLITISCIGAYLVNEHMEGLMVIILYEIGKILEEKAVNNSRKSISDLMNIKPVYANLENGKKVEPNSIKIGDIILVKIGEKIPLDGIVVEGCANLDISSLTGESKLVSIKPNDKVLSGSINTDGIIKIKVDSDYENSTVNRILNLVENATDKKAKTETFVNKASKIYTPIVLVLAILVGLFLPIITNLNYSQSVYRALIFLVISCPCSIAISVPLSYFSGIGRSSKEGILIKGSDYLDALKDVNKIVFDKTGTLTEGKFSVNKIDIFSKAYDLDKVLKYAVMGEQLSNHPIAKSIIEYYNKDINEKIDDFKEIKGKGISYKYNDKTVLVGNSNFVKYNKYNEIGTNVFVKINDEVIGCINLIDMLKQNAKEVIDELNKKNISCHMFTGDNKQIALNISKKLNIKDVKYELLPDDKYNELQKIINNNDKKIAFVGDGINDAPVIALADVGISMGQIGSSAAIEASDVVIMTDDLSKINQAINISKYTNKIIKQNLIFAITTKIIILIFSVVGIASMWQAIFADVGVTLITILNTLRILKKN